MTDTHRQFVTIFRYCTWKRKETL